MRAPAAGRLLVALLYPTWLQQGRRLPARLLPLLSRWLRAGLIGWPIPKLADRVP